MPIKMVTLKPHRYGTQRVVGEEYEVPGQSAKRMVEGMKWAKEAPKVEAPYVPPVRKYTARVMKADEAVKTEEPAKPKRTYFRRDLTAQKTED